MSSSDEHSEEVNPSPIKRNKRGKVSVIKYNYHIIIILYYLLKKNILISGY